jgi:medium-chain acyl-[acyl-carrier-protein] hydrolase
MDPWQVCLRPNLHAPLRLFCFPYAGGGASVFRRWHTALGEGVEVRAVQLPGRESRLREPPFRRLPPILDALVGALGPYLDRPFAFFGHSMGATIAYELARRLRRDGGPGPLRLFVSARQAPHLPWEQKVMHTLPDAELRTSLAELGGTPKEVLEHDELMRLLTPLLRADFTIVETYQHQSGQPLSCPITALAGLEDKGTPAERIEGWAKYTQAGFELHKLPGNHFFIHSAEEQALQIVRNALRLPPGPGPISGVARQGTPVGPPCRGGPDQHAAPRQGPMSGAAGQAAPTWADITAVPALTNDAVHVWRASLERSDDELTALEHTLSADERSRADRFCFPRDRRHYIAGRGILRALLARYLRCDPAALQFHYNPQGKPSLASGVTDPLRFNVSHSHGVAVYGITRGREIGIDVEQVRGEVAVDQLAERFFSPREVAALRALPASERRDAFFRIWARKEAYLKATGLGLSLPLDCFDVSLVPGEAALLATRNDPAEAARWTMRELAVADGFAAAFLVEGNSWRLWCGQWPNSVPRH